MRDDDRLLTSWARVIDAIFRGERPRQSMVLLGPTPPLLQQLGLRPVDLAMAAGKIAQCRRDHPEVPLSVWHDLPRLVGKPIAVVPSAKRDHSLVVVLVVSDAQGDPVVVPIVPGLHGSPNTVLSMYGKQAGHNWIRKQIEQAARDALPHFISKGFAATLPQPGSARAIPSSPGPIPADGTAKPPRQILRPREKSIGEPDEPR
ncbi:hypothetical protein [uncultured Sphingomonas sp.]|uniref:MuF-C-terminal domain-containing protein n=1 Tax=uncultured Sphingomonas sp. TaxID=158754 RepID=UPI0035CB6FD8